jgi:hypothetical protein
MSFLMVVMPAMRKLIAVAYARVGYFASPDSASASSSSESDSALYSP